MRSRLWSGFFLLIWCPQVSAQDVPGSGDVLHLLDAVQTSLSRHPALEIQQQQVEISDAVRRQASAVFDSVFETGVDRAHLYAPLRSNGTSFNLASNDTADIGASYSKLLRSGVAMKGTVAMRRDIETAAVRGGLTTSSTRLQVVFPLMRGRGTDVTTSDERAAALERDSSILDLRHVTTTLITRVVSSYWGLVAAQRSRGVAAASAQRGDLLVENTRALIAADQSPRADLASALANAADRQAARFSSEQAYIEARQQLILDMGLRLEELSERAVLDDFAALGQLPAIRDLPENVQPLIDAALERRADYLAAHTRVDAARLVREAARNGLLPEVNFSVNAGYTALAEGSAFNKYFSAVAGGVEGPDITGRISYRFPTRNNLATGRLAQADAQLQQATLKAADVARTIRSSVVSSYSALRNALLRLEKARESVEAFQVALRGEQDKLTLGIGSIINLLTIEDRLTAASEREVAAWRSYGQALVEFRFATGSLIPVRDPLPTLDDRTFTTFPFPATVAQR